MKLFIPNLKIARIVCEKCKKINRKKSVEIFKIVSFNKVLFSVLFALCKKRKCAIGNQNETVSKVKRYKRKLEQNQLEQRDLLISLSSNTIVYYQIDLFQSYSSKSSNSR